ncbi:hypothetical protein PoMZ_04160, partial [Pyricularia oryzae]
VCALNRTIPPTQIIFVLRRQPKEKKKIFYIVSAQKKSKFYKMVQQFGPEPPPGLRKADAGFDAENAPNHEGIEMAFAEK